MCSRRNLEIPKRVHSTVLYSLTYSVLFSHSLSKIPLYVLDSYALKNSLKSRTDCYSKSENRDITVTCFTMHVIFKSPPSSRLCEEFTLCLVQLGITSVKIYLRCEIASLEDLSILYFGREGLIRVFSPPKLCDT